MAFPYIVELQNVDTNQKFYHQVNSSEQSQVYNDKQRLTAVSIREFIMLYQPQCDKDMILMMYQDGGDDWFFLTEDYFVDLKNLQQIQDNADRARQVKFINSSRLNSSHFLNSSINSNKSTERHNIIFSVRFQCQAWVDQEDQGSSMLDTSMLSQKVDDHSSLYKKIEKIKGQIMQMEKLSYEFKDKFQVNSLGVSIFWANPLSAKDKIFRRPPTGQTQQYMDKEKNVQVLKSSVKCAPYIQAVAYELKKSEKKIDLNVEQFNQFSFMRRRYFKVVYLVCHTEVAEISINEYNAQAKKNHFPNFNQSNSDQIRNSDASFLFEIPTQEQKNQNLHNIEQNGQEDNEEDHLEGDKLKYTESIDFQQQDLDRIDQDFDENITSVSSPKKQDFNVFGSQYRESVMDTNDLQLDYMKLTENHEENDAALLQQAFGKVCQGELFSDGKRQQENFIRTKHEKAKKRRRKQQSKQKSIRSSSLSDSRSSLSKTKQKKGDESRIKRKSVIKKQSQKDSQEQIGSAKMLEIENTKGKRTTRWDKKKGKQSQDKKLSGESSKKKVTVSYFVGENKFGQMEKFSPQDLDDMLNYRKLENIQLLILHTSFPYAHLPVLKKHSNHILIINSNPVFPEACTIFFLKLFFRYLLKSKSVSWAHERALTQTAQVYGGSFGQTLPLQLTKNFSVDAQYHVAELYSEMQKVNREYANGSPYACCCYHQHESRCSFKSDKSATKYVFSHYKFHNRRCQCHFSGIMEHSCEDKLKNLRSMGVIDKKNYKSEMVYDCCCQGQKLGKYEHSRKNTSYNYRSVEGRNDESDDPHSIMHKYVLLMSESVKQRHLEQKQEMEIEKNQKKSKKQKQKANERDKREKQIAENNTIKKINTVLSDLHRLEDSFNPKAASPTLNQEVFTQVVSDLDVQDGQLEGDCQEQFQESIQYLSENKLIGNDKLIVCLLAYFQVGEEQDANFNMELEIPSTLQMRKSENINRYSIAYSNSESSMLSSRKSPKMLNSLIRQAAVDTLTPANRDEQKHRYFHELRICNLHGQNSTGRKTIAKYLANLMVFKHVFSSYVVKAFSKVEELKYLPSDPNDPIFYILLYKGAKNSMQINFEQLTLNPENLPRFIYAIIITNKRIKQHSAIKIFYESPKPFNDEEIKTYIKLHCHLSSQIKIKLSSFMQMTALDLQIPQLKGQGSIYANRIDPYEVISVVKRSNYNGWEDYISSIEKMHNFCYPQYMFIMSIVHQSFQNFEQGSAKPSRKHKKLLQTSFNQILRRFMEEKRSFYLKLDPKKNKNKKKNQKLENNQKQGKTPKQGIKTPELTAQEGLCEPIQEREARQAKFHKEQIINIRNVLNYYPLLFQKFQKRIKERCSESIRIFVHFSTLHFTDYFSQSTTFSKAHLNNFVQSNQQKGSFTHFRTRHIIYEPDFYQTTTVNPQSFINSILAEEIQQCENLFGKSNQSLDLSQPSQQQSQNQNILARIKQEMMNQMRLNEQTSLNEFFLFFSRFMTGDKDNELSLTPALLKNTGKLSHDSPQSKIEQTKQYLNENTSTHSFPLRTDQRQSASKSKNKSRTTNFFEKEKHLRILASAGLTYIRGLLGSHLTYNLLNTNQCLQVIKSSLLLINNAIILMKTPDIKAYTNRNKKLMKPKNSFFRQESYENQNSLDSEEDSNRISNSEASSDETPSIFRTTSANESQSVKKELRSPMSLNQKEESRRLSFVGEPRLKNTNAFGHSTANSHAINTSEDPFSPILSVNGLLFLLFKIRERCEGLILKFNDLNRSTQVNITTNMCILAELFTMQLHIQNLYKGSCYEPMHPKQFGVDERAESYINEILFNRNRSINYLKEALLFSEQSKFKKLQIHIMSCYILMISQCGRRKINQSMADQLCRIKNDMDQKSGTSNSMNDYGIDQPLRYSRLSAKGKVLLHLCESVNEFERIYTLLNSIDDKSIVFINTTSQRLKNQPHTSTITESNSKSSLKYSHDVEYSIFSHNSHSNSLMPSTHSQEHPHFHSIGHDESHKRNPVVEAPNDQNNKQKQTDVFIELLEKHARMRAALTQRTPLKIYAKMCELLNELKKQSLQRKLLQCSANIFAFSQQLFHQIESQMSSLRDKYIVYMKADPVYHEKTVGLKSSVLNSSSRTARPSTDEFRKRVKHQAAQKTIILNNWPTVVAEKICDNHSQHSAHQGEHDQSPSPNPSSSSSFNQTSRNFNQRMSSSFDLTTSLNLITNQSFSPNKRINMKSEASHPNRPLNAHHSGHQHGQHRYPFFSSQMKLNQERLHQLQKARGCKYMCINTTVSGKQIVFEAENGQMLLYERAELAEFLKEINVNAIFVCLPKSSNLADELLPRVKKNVIYFDFKQGLVSGSGNFLTEYYRMVMQQTVRLILQRITKPNNKQVLKLQEAFNYVVNHYEFVIEGTKKGKAANEGNEGNDHHWQQCTVFQLPNETFRMCVFSSAFKLKPEQKSKHICIHLSQSDIATAEEVQQVRKVLNKRNIHQKYSGSQAYSPQKEKISGIVRLEHMGFWKFLLIMKYYLQDKESYHKFFCFDLDQFRYGSLAELKAKKISEQSSQNEQFSIPSGLESKPSTQSMTSTESSKRKKKQKQESFFYQDVRPVDRWKSDFFQHILKKDVISYFMSRKKVLMVFLNSQLLTREKPEKEDWARDLFDSLFDLNTYDSYEKLSRSVSSVHVILANEDQSHKKHPGKDTREALLYFFQ